MYNLKIYIITHWNITWDIHDILKHLWHYDFVIYKEIKQICKELGNSWFRKGNTWIKFETLVRRRLSVALKEW